MIKPIIIGIIIEKAFMYLNKNIVETISRITVIDNDQIKSNNNFLFLKTPSQVAKSLDVFLSNSIPSNVI
jgi:hypothetical protein